MAVSAPDRALVLSQLTEADIRELYPTKVGAAELQRRIWLVSPSEIMAAIQSKKINEGHYLAFLSDEQLKEIKISQLSQDVLHNLAFPYGVEDSERRRRFAQFHPEEVVKALEGGLLSTEYDMKLLSDEQLRHIQLTKLGFLERHNLIFFNGSSEKERIYRFAQFHPEEVVKALEGEHLTYEFPKYFSDEQIRHVRLSKLTYRQMLSLFPDRESEAMTARRFSLFSPDDVMQALKDDKLSSLFCSKFISDKQIRALKISELGSELISDLFPEKEHESTNRRRFALLDTDEVKKAVMDDKLSGYLLSLRSEEQK